VWKAAYASCGGRGVGVEPIKNSKKVLVSFNIILSTSFTVHSTDVIFLNELFINFIL
jgi:hypothetical protein